MRLAANVWKLQQVSRSVTANKQTKKKETPVRRGPDPLKDLVEAKLHNTPKHKKPVVENL